MSRDDSVAAELRAQEERRRVEEERLKEKLRLAEAEDKKREKQNKRKEKKTQVCIKQDNDILIHNTKACPLILMKNVAGSFICDMQWRESMEEAGPTD